ncbi:sigma factor-like helix-turn-helix DNA-binding protein [Arthrobacter bambusae]|uniref:sigma factor-like helix-turn-helix DNA-binding protein n=1 Tax=Arthrobacter bambusae TaxID=1338426 RepID=UPI00278B0B5C|nr:sigma factor-like helix-turn-helix DNA-binding protein [Arthrobacter bambusae]MDQ0029545.1 DNA-binding NarL/FixJ family response regulator [Arthrobacter bambusae]MDQ0097205.1 DNA-binding NarL/FixJ family response regulator [Arthrobacter bambusae]
MTRVLLIERHQLLIDSLSQWLRMNTPEIRVLAGASWPPESAGLQGDGARTADVAVVGELQGREAGNIAGLVASLRGSGMQVVLLADHHPAMAITSALDAGALAVVPKSAEPGHTAAAIRAAASGRRYLHPDIKGLLESPAVARVELSARERRLVELYLGPTPRSIKEVAELLAISEQTVKSHLHRVRQRYAGAGLKVGNIISLQDQLRKDGWLS